MRKRNARQPAKIDRKNFFPPELDGSSDLAWQAMTSDSFEPDPWAAAEEHLINRDASEDQKLRRWKYFG